MINKGVLLLISAATERARIELGGEWGRDWDAHAATIMNQSIIPRFKQKDFPRGILAGVKGLSEMTLNDPKSSAPSGGFRWFRWSRVFRLPRWASGPSPGDGAGHRVDRRLVFPPPTRKWLLIVGGGWCGGDVGLPGLILVGVHSGNPASRVGWGGFSSSGGFLSGGFSGGGGASGSW
ncbi:MAG: hypothetical protein Ct9H300mP1_16330 [Planctomycetaceae bacterium]|nr:MAG: hypothetical protein Ct9H300mP1_16330 [Planctomycetaceae bacterium]